MSSSVDLAKGLALVIRCHSDCGIDGCSTS